ncbi:hypothetical protein HMI51_03355 [Corallococcus coralloides]|nr:hypothetical protein [Corallococcus coralloides]
MSPQKRPSPNLRRWWNTRATVGDVVMTDMIAGASTPRAQTIERRLSMPDGPLEGQARPPCQSPSREVNGGAGSN